MKNSRIQEAITFSRRKYAQNGANKSEVVRQVLRDFPEIQRKDALKIFMDALDMKEVTVNAYFYKYRSIRDGAQVEKNENVRSDTDKKENNKGTMPGWKNFEKHTYLENEHVDNFIKFISDCWRSFSNDVEAKIEVKNKAGKKYRKSNESESKYYSLQDACHDYSWNQKNFKENTEDLEGFREIFLENLKNADASSDFQLFYNVCSVLLWGGVLTNSIGVGFHDLVSGDGKLRQYLNNAKSDKGLCGEQNTSGVLDLPGDSLLSDSGATKVYTTISDACIIYDDRVACSICALVLMYCLRKNLNEVPEPLRFAQASDAGRKFKKKGSNCYSGLAKWFKDKNTDDHAYSNLYVNWICLAVIEKIEEKEEKKLSVPPTVREENIIWWKMRIIESALFMAGHRSEGWFKALNSCRSN